MRLKVIGAGSVGNHLSHAARSLGWTVVLCDSDPAALERTRKDIYPARYGKFDENIELCHVDDAPRGHFDLICVGTPPDTHLAVAARAIEEEPRAVLVEKPLCGPVEMVELASLTAALSQAQVRGFVGYDHVTSECVGRVERALKDGHLGELVGLDVDFREHWSGIFAAHPWLDGPADSYLGYWRRGGGASGEHSHALNLWQHFARMAGWGEVAAVSAVLDHVSDGAMAYDQSCMFTLRTDRGNIGRVVQDVITVPPVKRVSLQGTEGRIDCELTATRDTFTIRAPDAEPVTETISKVRPDDFIAELRHIRDTLDDPGSSSPIDIEHGVSTMAIIEAAHGKPEHQGWQPVHSDNVTRRRHGS